MKENEEYELLATSIDLNLNLTNHVSDKLKLTDLLNLLTNDGLLNYIKLIDTETFKEEFVDNLSNQDLKKVFEQSNEIDINSETLFHLVQENPHLALETSEVTHATILSTLLTRDLSKLIDLLHVIKKDTMENGNTRLNKDVFSTIVKHLNHWTDLIKLYQTHEWIFNQDVNVIQIDDWIKLLQHSSFKTLLTYFLLLPTNQKLNVPSMNYVNYLLGLTDDYTPDKDDLFFLNLVSICIGEFNLEFAMISSVTELKVIQRLPQDIVKHFVLTHKKLLQDNYYFLTVTGLIGLADDMNKLIQWAVETFPKTLERNTVPIGVMKELTHLFFKGIGKLPNEFDFDSLVYLVNSIASKDKRLLAGLNDIQNPTVKRALITTGNLQAKL
jgi:hypothetical protein